MNEHYCLSIFIFAIKKKYHKIIYKMNHCILCAQNMLTSLVVVSSKLTTDIYLNICLYKFVRSVFSVFINLYSYISTFILIKINKKKDETL